MSKFYEFSIKWLIKLSAFITVSISFIIIGFIIFNGINKINCNFIFNDFDSKSMYLKVDINSKSIRKNNDYNVEVLLANVKKTNNGFLIEEIDENSPLKFAKDNKGCIRYIKRNQFICDIKGLNIKDFSITQLNEFLNNIDNTITLKVKDNGGGILPMLISTLIIVLLSLLFSLPVSIFSAIYLVMYAKQGKLLNLIRFSIECLAGIPSIVYGLFGMIFFVIIMKLGYSLLAGALTMSIMILPLIIRTTEESLKTVPSSYLDASLALGATKFKTIFKIILPSSFNGIITSVILSIGRIIGESAASLLTVGTVARIPNNIFSSGATLTVKAYTIAKEEGNIKMACGIGIIVLLLLLSLNIISKILGKLFNKNYVN